MPHPVLVFLVGIGLGVGLTLLGLAARYLRRREREQEQAALLAAFNAALEAMEQRWTEKALGMVRDITLTRAETPVSLTPKLDAIEAERAAWEFAHLREVHEASLARFNELMGRRERGK